MIMREASFSYLEKSCFKTKTKQKGRNEHIWAQTTGGQVDVTLSRKPGKCSTDWYKLQSWIRFICPVRASRKKEQSKTF